MIVYVATSPVPILRPSTTSLTTQHSIIHNTYPAFIPLEHLTHHVAHQYNAHCDTPYPSSNTCSCHAPYTSLHATHCFTHIHTHTHRHAHKQTNTHTHTHTHSLHYTNYHHLDRIPSRIHSSQHAHCNTPTHTPPSSDIV